MDDLLFAFRCRGGSDLATICLNDTGHIGAFWGFISSYGRGERRSVARITRQVSGDRCGGISGVWLGLGGGGGGGVRRWA